MLSEVKCCLLCCWVGLVWHAAFVCEFIVWWHAEGTDPSILSRTALFGHVVAIMALRHCFKAGANSISCSVTCANMAVVAYEKVTVCSWHSACASVNVCLNVGGSLPVCGRREMHDCALSRLACWLRWLRNECFFGL